MELCQVTSPNPVKTGHTLTATMNRAHPGQTKDAIMNNKTNLEAQAVEFDSEDLGESLALALPSRRMPARRQEPDDEVGGRIRVKRRRPLSPEDWN